jgi:hypothetical protein
MAAPIKWLRLYDDLLDDPKVQRLEPYLFKAWINLLCLANKSETRGLLPPLADIAWRLRMSEEETEAILDALTAAGLIDEMNGHRVPHNWGERQKPSDDGNKRVAEWRERQKEQGLPLNGHVTLQPEEDVTLQETSQVTPRVRRGRAEADRDLEREQSRAEGECERETAPPACLPFVASDDSAPPPILGKPIPPPPKSLREFAAPLLSEADIADLLTSGPEPRGSPRWSEAEIREGVSILRERKGNPKKPKAYLHTSILPEVRAGKRANAPPKPKTPPPEETAEEIEAFQRRKAQELAALRAKREQRGVSHEIPPLPG